MNALMGYNGTGKTRLLSNLAIVASGFGYSSKEELLAKSAGRFVGNPPPFDARFYGSMELRIDDSGVVEWFVQRNSDN